MRVGLFGGSFDPPHEGHAALARAAADAFALDMVLVAPAGRQPLKAEHSSAPFEDRMRMVTLMCAGDPRLVACDIDAPRPDGQPNYTVDTLETLRRTVPAAEIFGIIGADAYLGMSHWREPAKLFELAQWIVATRPGFELERADGIHRLDTMHVDISATGIRERLQRGEDCHGLIAPAVLAYIEEHGLYRDGQKA